MLNLCLGTAQLGMPYGIANTHGKPNEEEASNIVRTALANGITYFDTAQAYGDSEIVLGRAFSVLSVTDQVKCVSKLSPEFIGLNSDLFIDKVMVSLKNLQLSTLWGLMMHRPMKSTQEKDIYKNIDILKERGLLEYFGVSIYEPSDAIKYAADPNIDIIQVPFNVLDRRLLDRGFFELADKNKKTVFVRSLYLQGLLLLTEQELETKGLLWAREYLQNLKIFVETKKMSIKQFALSCSLKTLPKVFFVLGVETDVQLQENINVISNMSLDDSDINEWWRLCGNYPAKLLNPSLW